MKVEMVCPVNRSRRGIPGQQRHREHHAFLNPSGPAKIPAQNHGTHHSAQIEKIDAALNMHPASRLDLFGKRSGCFNVFSEKNVLIENVEHDEKRGDRKCPLWNQSERPVERYATKK